MQASNIRYPPGTHSPEDLIATTVSGDSLTASKGCGFDPQIHRRHPNLQYEQNRSPRVHWYTVRSENMSSTAFLRAMEGTNDLSPTQRL
jgi:hypothetical protein